MSSSISGSRKDRSFRLHQVSAWARLPHLPAENTEQINSNANGNPLICNIFLLFFQTHRTTNSVSQSLLGVVRLGQGFFSPFCSEGGEKCTNDTRSWLAEGGHAKVQLLMFHEGCWWRRSNDSNVIRLESHPHLNGGEPWEREDPAGLFRARWGVMKMLVKNFVSIIKG